MAVQFVVCIGASNAKVYGKPIHDGSKVVIIVEGASSEKIAKLNKALEELKARGHDDVMVVSGPAFVEEPVAYEAKRVREFRGS